MRGNDAWSGRTRTPNASKSSGPWRTFGPLAATTLKSGDSVHLRCGDTWHSQLTIKGTGRVGAPITVEGYRHCAAGTEPRLDLAESVSNWVAIGGGVYAAPVNFHAYAVYVDGQYLRQARFPSAGWAIADGGIPSIRQGHGSSGLLVPALSPEEHDLSHSVLHVRTVGWHIESVFVSGYISGRILLAGITKYPIRRGAGYYLTGARWMLNHGPGWYQDQDTGRLFVRLPDNCSPRLQNIEASRFRTGVSIQNQTDIVVNGLQIVHAGTDGVHVTDAKRVLLTHMDVTFSKRNAIAYTDGSTGTIENSRIQSSGHDGILVDHADGIRILDNTVLSTGMLGSPKNSPAVIDATNSDSDVIEQNVIDGAGYIGIRFNRDSQIIDNIVRNTCLVLDDCGAIYSWDYVDPRPLHSSVIGNIIRNVRGNSIGNPDQFSIAAGIYLDDRSNDVVVERNTISDVERGIYVHDGFDNVIRYNTIFEYRKYGIVLGMNDSREVTGGDIPNTVSNNTIVSRTGHSPLFYLDSANKLFGDKLTNNEYLGPKLKDGALVQWTRGMDNPYTLSALAHIRSNYNVNLIRVPLRTSAVQPTLLLNETSSPESLRCPMNSVRACLDATDPEGMRLYWPVKLPKFASLIVVWQ